MPECRICGRCATFCPEHAIKLSIDNPRVVEDVIESIESHVKW